MSSSHAALLLGLRERIPGMICIPGCTACCAHVPWSKTEWEMLPEEVRGKHSVHSMKCPFLVEGGCGCYDQRAITCRVYGVAQGLPCPRGAVADKILSAAEMAEISKQYKTLFEE